MSDASDPTPMHSAQPVPPWASGTEGRDQELYPTLTDHHVDILRTYGEERSFASGTRLWNIGDKRGAFYLVLEGTLDIIRHDRDGEVVFITHGPGNFAGELATMSGRGALVAGAAGEALRALVIDADDIRDCIAVEAELGEIILQSFILRRMRMISSHLGDLLLFGDVATKETASLREFMSRNGLPYRVIDPLDPADASDRAAYGLEGAPLPTVLCGPARLETPSAKEIADHLGLSADLPDDALFDVGIVGAGPAGLAAAVYAASEGLSVVVFEKCAVGGQAGSSSRIENYLGFPTGISGQALTGRGFLQAQKFGAEVALARDAIGLTCGDREHVIALEDGTSVRVRSVILASGAVYRQPQIADLAAFESTCVHYGANHIQGMLCRNKDVAIIGGGNSAGQAAVFLAKMARSVTIMVRGEGLAASMSQYLIRRIERTPNITLLPHTEVIHATGTDAVLEGVTIKNNRTNERQALPVSHLFVFIGAAPASDLARDVIALDEKGFVKTGPALSQDDLSAAGWPLNRQPFLLETCCPRIFAAGDIRSGSTKRVASAVGEGSICVQFVHSVLQETEPV